MNVPFAFTRNHESHASHFLLILAACLLISQPVRSQVTQEQVDRFAAMLPEKPRGIGPTIEDRKVWDAIGRQPAYAHIIENAERLLDSPPPPWSDEVYLEFSRTGSRVAADRVNADWINRLAMSTLAEMVENKGRFLPALERDISAFLDRKTWISPAHENHDFTNFKGTFHDADIYSTHAVWILATIDHWLGGKLSPALRDRIRKVARERQFDTYLEIVRTGRYPAVSPHGWNWMTSTGNHNTAGTAAVVGAGLALLDSREDRALLLAGAERAAPPYLDGFPADGYCSEGLQYWNYGFSSYFLLAEAIRDATGGKMDLYRDPAVKTISGYTSRLEMAGGLYPIYADGTPETNPNRPWFLDLIQRRIDVGRPDWLLAEPTNHSPSYLYHLGTTAAVDRSTPPLPKAEAPPPELPLRDSFPESQVYVFRPKGARSYDIRKGVVPGTDRSFTFSFKGGNNNEYHNHNDIGSFVVGVGHATPIADPGREVYTADTFGQNRYKSEINNSFGHSLPLVAERLQSFGTRFAARVLEERFGDREDRVTLDLSGAYRVPGLETLTRTFVYSREGEGSLTVSDSVSFAGDIPPQTFGTALVTTGEWKETAPNRLVIADGDGAVEVEVFSTAKTDSGKPSALKIASVPVEGRLASGRKATRIGFDFAEPVRSGTITLTIRPGKSFGSVAAAEPVFPEGRKPDESAALRIEAETVAEETGGKTEQEHKVGSSGLTLKYWETPSHSLGWRVAVPCDGDYALRLRYCSESAAPGIVRAAWNGVPFGDGKTGFSLSPTGGWSNTSDDWRTAWLSENGHIVTAPLKAGENHLTLTLTRGPLNLDWVELVPVGKSSSPES